VTTVDEYVVFCRGVRTLCRIDLEQYKRGQMERRIRSFASSRGVAALAEYLRLLRRDRTELDAFLDRITINVSQLLEVPVRAYDLVLCRNTVIYFTPEVRDGLHGRLAAALRPGGVLLVGSTERVADPASLGLRELRPFTYRREG
jgi:chemotaxis methyl-accepting protein methylase